MARRACHARQNAILRYRKCPLCVTGADLRASSWTAQATPGSGSFAQEKNPRKHLDAVLYTCYNLST